MCSCVHSDDDCTALADFEMSLCRDEVEDRTAIYVLLQLKRIDQAHCQMLSFNKAEIEAFGLT